MLLTGFGVWVSYGFGFSVQDLGLGYTTPSLLVGCEGSIGFRTSGKPLTPS